MVNVPRERFIELVTAPDNVAQWLDGLLSFEASSGLPGQDGATSQLTFKRGRGTMEMIEAIVRRQFRQAGW